MELQKILMDFSFFTLSNPFRIEAAYSFENALIEENISIALIRHLCTSFCFGGGRLYLI